MQVFFKSHGAQAADRGELDKRIERSGAVAAVPGSRAQLRARPDLTDSDFGHDHGDQAGSQGQRKRSCLKDNFD